VIFLKIELEQDPKTRIFTLYCEEDSVPDIQDFMWDYIDSLEQLGTDSSCVGIIKFDYD
jgi:hypothetical protein